MVHTIYVLTCYVRLSMFERKRFNSRLFVSAQNKQKLWFTHKPQNWFSKQFYLTSAIANTKQTLICLFSEVRTSMTSYKGIHVCLLVRVKATRGTRNTLSLYRVAHDVLCGTVWKFNLDLHTEIRNSNFFYHGYTIHCITSSSSSSSYVILLIYTNLTFSIIEQWS